MFKVTRQCPSCGQYYVESDAHKYKDLCSEKCSREYAALKQGEESVAKLLNNKRD